MSGIDQSPNVKAPAPFRQNGRDVQWQGLSMTRQQQDSLDKYLRSNGLDPSTATQRGNTVYVGSKVRFGIFRDDNRNIVVTGSFANSPGGINGAGFAINRSGSTVERTDVPTKPLTGRNQGPGGGAGPVKPIIGGPAIPKPGFGAVQPQPKK